MGQRQHFFRRACEVAGSARLLLAVLAAALCLACTVAEAKKPAKADPKPDVSMQFAVVRASGPACEPNCPEWIWAEGEIFPGTADRFRKFLKTVGKRKLPVVIQSPGGSVGAALAIGRMIRAKGLDVAVGYTAFSSCAPRQKNCDAEKTGGYRGVAAAGYAYCYSACPLVLAAGTRRLVGSWASLGVHQVTTTYVTQRISYEVTTRIVHGKKVVKKRIVGRKNTGSYATTKLAKGQRKQIETYLSGMGVSTGLVDLMVKTPAADLLKLDQNQMLSLKLITGMDQVDALVGSQVCEDGSAPGNCPLGKRPVQDMAKAQVQAGAAPTEITGYLVGTPASRDSYMQFYLVRGSDPKCNPDCPEWISAEGLISSITPRRFTAFLASIDDRRLPIVMSSGGGDIIAALSLGRIIHQRQLDVAVAKTRFVTCTPETAGCAAVDGAYAGKTDDAAGECGQACPLVLAGGIHRLVGPNAVVTLHSVGLEELVASYLDGFGFDRRFLQEMQSVVFTEHRRIDLPAMYKMRLVTGRETALAFTAPDVCREKARPGNCRALAVSN